MRYLESSGSPLTSEQKAKMNRELHSDPSLGHKTKGSAAMAKESKAKYHMTHITHHSDGSHTVEHEHHRKASKSGAFSERPENESYSVGSGKELVGKLNEHLGIGAAKAAGSQEKELEAAEHEPPHESEAEEEQTSEGV